MQRRAISSKIKSKYIFFLLIIIVLFFGLYLSRLHKNSKEALSSALNENELLIDYTIDESLAYTLINTNGIDEYGDLFVVFERNEDTWQRSYENDFKNLMPWKVELADIDGDNITEILIALRKTTPYDKEIKNRMFVFNYQDDILSRKWTGSRIAGIWREFYPMELLSTPGQELVFIEQAEDDKEKISIYSWFDFGFFMIADSEAYPMIQNVTMKGENSLEITYYEEEEEKSQILSIVEGKLLAKEDD
ncbi:MAG: hypothetical protein GX129_10320 [Clostridiales bacterium]|nr:hypothetical protein [Clostridiales bacterium]